LLGRQQGINLRSFQTEAGAVEWLKTRLESEERRRRQIPAPRAERRQRDPDAR
jgi:predicted DNA-binding WGR domain protein